MKVVALQALEESEQFAAEAYEAQLTEAQTNTCSSGGAMRVQSVPPMEFRARARVAHGER